MDGGDRVIRRRKSLTERLGLKGIGCCGSTWGIMPPTTFNGVHDENDVIEVMSHHIHTPPETTSATTTCLATGGGSSRMNLAAALAVECHFRADYDNNNEVNIHLGSRPNPNSYSSPLRLNVSGSRNVPTYDNNDEVNIHPGSRPDPNSRPNPDSNSSPLRPDERGPRNGVRTYDNNEVNIHSSSRLSPNSNLGSSRDEGILKNLAETPTRMSLMRLLEETEVYEGELLMEDEGSDNVCCVCMRRKKGAAFIPCGHTFCRACSRELWVMDRGCCPLCNRSILEILDIY